MNCRACPAVHRCASAGRSGSSSIPAHGGEPDQALPDGGDFPGDFDLSGLDASPDEIGAILNAAAEVDAEMDADAEAAATWVASMSDAELAALEREWLAESGGMAGADLPGDVPFLEALASYEADQALPGPQLARADEGGVIDLAGSMSDIDAMLAQMTNKEHERQVQDAAEQGHRRGSTEVRLANAMRRVDAGTYVYGQEPAVGLASDPAVDALFSTGPTLNAAEVRDQMRYALTGGAKPQGRGRFTPPVRDLATRIGLR